MVSFLRINKLYSHLSPSARQISPWEQASVCYILQNHLCFLSSKLWGQAPAQHATPSCRSQNQCSLQACWINPSLDT